MAKPTTASNVQDTNPQNFDGIINSNTVTVADFWAEWCGPCKQTEPMFRRVADKYSEKAAFVRVNADENQELVQKHGVMSLPAFLVFKNGQVKESAFGGIGQGKLEGMIQKQLL
ncbi:putative thioredoxin [Candidatus Nitrososphaera gargensis Ga9.2]|uniref:Putative thioredoxin n=1 Tax=Nitrososphaera gargensis (strain Ga9.2) TaxID=1237085 RepID=K0ICL8_NITGG|nr:thioredoxin family protein [Candidatus Nitrososphaera gargensis]AFU57370.1 putative thioredoxin [Candidatus Nitrososphaera gargensis Ga9.2]